MVRILLVVGLLTIIACARVNVETAKPLKVDINMRLDVYQHVVKDIDSIEDQVYGNQEKKMNFLMSWDEAYAADFSQDVQQAIERRKNRIDLIEEYFQNGYVGENRNGELTIIDPGLPEDLKAQILPVIGKENEDRVIIYQATARKNNVPLSDVRRIVLLDHFNRAPGGYSFEMYNEEKGVYQWIKK
ncbi:MAG: DUF1318 domain-containing protein [Candidatus Omnitrophica bacterium]|nr:DUF1318 domain-containing protein [Candidatus Omnitrophota bacterium]